MNVVQTGFGQDISFLMRTFWFNAQTSSTTGQGQTVECTLRLDPVASVSSTQPATCTCFTKTDCAAPGIIRTIFNWFKTDSKFQILFQFFQHGMIGLVVV